LPGKLGNSVADLVPDSLVALCHQGLHELRADDGAVLLVEGDKQIDIV
jgi:hypothetical protein